jgi:integrase
MKKQQGTIERGIARVSRDGREFFRVQLSGHKVGGTRISHVCKTYEEAQRYKAACLKMRCAPPAHLDPVRGTLVSTVAHGMADYIARLKAQDQNWIRARQILPALERCGLLTKPLHEITSADFYAYRQARTAEGILDSTIHRDMTCLAAMVAIARPGFTLPKKCKPEIDSTRVRFLAPEEEAKVFALLEEPFYTMCRLALLTLMRQGTIRTLQVDRVFVTEGLVALRKTKTGPKAVVLGRDALGLLVRQIARLPANARYVFPNPAGVPYSGVHVSRVWRKAARAAGLKDFHYHDLKHHGASVAVNNGASDQDLMRLGQWSRREQIERYGFVVNGRLRELADAIPNGMPYH